MKCDRKEWKTGNGKKKLNKKKLKKITSARQLTSAAL